MTRRRANANLGWPLRHTTSALLALLLALATAAVVPSAVERAGAQETEVVPDAEQTPDAQTEPGPDTEPESDTEAAQETDAPQDAEPAEGPAEPTPETQPAPVSEPAQQAGPPTLDNLIQNGAAYYGRVVTVSGQVANVVDPIQGLIDPMAFTVMASDQAAAAGVSPGELLVIRAPTTMLDGPALRLETRDQVQVTGAVVVFNPSEIEQVTGLNLDEQALQGWSGRPALIAWDVDELVAPDTQSGQPAEEPGATLSSLIATPADFYGNVVTVQGQVANVFDPLEQVPGPIAFTMRAPLGAMPAIGVPADGTGPAAEVLVIHAPLPDLGMGGSVAAGGQVEVTGPVLVFNLAEIERATGLDLQNQALMAWNGRPAIIAWSVDSAP